MRARQRTGDIGGARARLGFTGSKEGDDRETGIWVGISAGGERGWWATPATRGTHLSG